MYAASAIAANTVVRSAAGSAAPLFTNQMFTALGIGPGGSVVGAVGVLLAIIPFLFYRYGEKIRAKSRFAPTGPKEQHSEEDKAEKGRAGTGDDTEDVGYTSDGQTVFSKGDQMETGDQ